MSDKTIKINYRKEMRSLINQIKSIGLKNNGILFGGVVRDDIIGTHYRNLFIEKEGDFSKYWDDNYDVETNKRLIIPNDIDIFFKEDNNKLSFINTITKFIYKFGGYIYVSPDNKFNQLNYVNNLVFLKHNVVNINVVIGSTFTQSGTRLKLNIDIISVDYSQNTISNVMYSNYVNDFEPPFYNLDFLSNVFITESRTNSTTITRMSNCTGTPLDTMVFTRKTEMSARIINDIINLRTQFTRNVDCVNAEYINCFRIIKMIDRIYSWTITNLPFRLVNVADITEDINDKCCICLEDINITSENKETFMKEYKNIVELSINKKTHFHSHCFMSYLSKEQKNRYHDEGTGKIECRCPYRNFFNFRHCHRNIEYI